jgi:hypothetical protein
MFLNICVIIIVVLILSIIKKPVYEGLDTYSCDVQCKPEYIQTGKSTTYTCDGETLNIPDIDCTKPANCYIKSSLGEGIIGAGSVPCSPNLLVSSGDTCDVKCDSGFVADSGSITYKCDNGSFSEKAGLTCTPKPCPLPSSLDKGVVGGPTLPCVDGMSLQSSKVCNIDCDTGYMGNGGSTQYGCYEGDLTSPSVTCTPEGCPLPKYFGKGIVGGGGDDGCVAGNKLQTDKSCSVKCDINYKWSSGSETYSCAKGDLAAASLICEPVTCPLPSEFETGIEPTSGDGCKAGTALSGGGSCSVQCSEGYNISSGSGKYQCSNTGSLVAANLVCKPISCQLPTSFDDGVISGDSNPCAQFGVLLGGKECSVQCDDGYVEESGFGAYICSTKGVLTNGNLKCKIPAERKKGITRWRESIKQDMEFKCSPELDEIKETIEIDEPGRQKPMRTRRRNRIEHPISSWPHSHWRSWR